MSLGAPELLFSFTAGFLTIFSPCGLALFPGYISYTFGAKVSSKRVVISSIASTLGLLLVFGSIGIITSLAGGFLYQYAGLSGVVAGLLVVFMGFTILLNIRIPSLKIFPRSLSQGGAIGLFTYGVVYGLGAFGCSAPIFYSMLFIVMGTEGLSGGVLAFLLYSFGISLPLISASILAVTGRSMILKSIVKYGRQIHTVTGIILISIGLYLIYFNLLLQSAI